MSHNPVITMTLLTSVKSFWFLLLELLYAPVGDHVVTLIICDSHLRTM